MLSAVVSKIISMNPSFTKSEAEIAQYVINNQETVAYNTITTIAKNTNTSEASINRFCKKVGYKGFNGLKVALVQETFYNSMLSKEAGKGDGIIDTVSHDYTNLLISTASMLDKNVIERAVDAIRAAGRIFILGFDTTQIVADDFSLKLSMCGIQSHQVSLSCQIKTLSSIVNHDDLVVAIVPTVLMKDIFQTLYACKAKKANVLTISSFDSPKLNNISDFKFITSDKITTTNAIGLSNNIVYLYVTDIIYCALLEKDKTLMKLKIENEARLMDQIQMEHYMLE